MDLLKSFLVEQTHIQAIHFSHRAGIFFPTVVELHRFWKIFGYKASEYDEIISIVFIYESYVPKRRKCFKTAWLILPVLKILEGNPTRLLTFWFVGCLTSAQIGHLEAKNKRDFWGLTIPVMLAEAGQCKEGPLQAFWYPAAISIPIPAFKPKENNFGGSRDISPNQGTAFWDCSLPIRAASNLSSDTCIHAYVNASWQLHSSPG